MGSIKLFMHFNYFIQIGLKNRHHQRKHRVSCNNDRFFCSISVGFLQTVHVWFHISEEQQYVSTSFSFVIPVDT